MPDIITLLLKIAQGAGSLLLIAATAYIQLRHGAPVCPARKRRAGAGNSAAARTRGQAFLLTAALLRRKRPRTP